MNFLNLFSSNKSEKQKKEKTLRLFIATQNRVEKLPELSAIEKTEFEQGVDLEHLYYSSKIEGTNLTKEDMNKVVHG